MPFTRNGVMRYEARALPNGRLAAVSAGLAGTQTSFMMRMASFASYRSVIEVDGTFVIATLASGSSTGISWVLK